MEYLFAEVFSQQPPEINQYLINTAILDRFLQHAEVITITFPSNTTWIFTGFMVGYEPDAPHLGKMTAAIRVQVTGTSVIDSEGAGEGDASAEV